MLCLVHNNIVDYLDFKEIFRFGDAEAKNISRNGHTVWPHYTLTTE